jgi:hypothetical protein
MVLACAGVLGWLLVLTIALRLGVAAKRGDELGKTAQRYRPDTHVDAQIIPFARAKAVRGSLGVPGADPVQQVVHDFVLQPVADGPADAR